MAMDAPFSRNSAVLERDNQACGGDASLSQCGDSFPSDFCCPVSTQCLLLDTTDAIATLCCPEGQTCGFVTPIRCDLNAQNATLVPNSGYHSDPTMQLDSCGSGCCPAGAQCRNGACQIFTASPSDQSSASSSSIIAPTSSAAATPASAAPTTTSSPTPATVGANSSDPTGEVTVNKSFSGSSFAAGFIPGIVIGIIIIVCILWCLSRRRKARSAYGDEKYLHSNDQLTDLSTNSAGNEYRPRMHQRSISEPIADPTNGHRTDFSRSTPPRFPEPAHTDMGYTATVTGPPTPPVRTPKIKALFARSPIFPATSSPRTPPTDPLPSHLKRGTLSHAYTISPIRALRTKKSMHSLRRQMNTAPGTSQVSRTSSRRHPQQQRPDVSRENSTETIQVLMPSMEPYTPDQRSHPAAEQERQPAASLPPATYHPPSILPACPSIQPSTASLVPPNRKNQGNPRYYAPASLYSLYSKSPSQTAQPEPPSLGTPYTPTRPPGASATNISMNVSPVWGKGKGKVTGVLLQPDGGLTVERAQGDNERRQTTFSGFMERAGISREQFVGAGGK